jgi:hypothetical protein
VNRARSGVALATSVALFSLASGAAASTNPAASRAVLAPTPSPSPSGAPVFRAGAVDQAQRTLDLKQIVTQRMAALSRLQPRTFKSPRSMTNVVGSGDVQIAGRSGAGFTHQVDYCAQHPPEIDRVSGKVTPSGVLTISGLCFGTTGTVRITGIFPYESAGLDLPIESWTDTVVKVRMFGHAYGSFGSTTDSFTGAPDQQIELRLMPRRVAGGLVVISPNLVSSVRLNFTARRITTMAAVDTLTCASGEPLDAQRPDFCGEYGWGSFSCDVGKCMESYHARKAATSGEDVYSVRLGHGYVLNEVMVFGDGADLVFDPTLDPSHVTFRIRWHTMHKSDPDLVKRGNPQYADYNDGSYMFFPTMTGPDGVRP